MILIDLFLEVIRKQPLLIALYRYEICLIQFQTLKISEERRVFNQYGISGIDHRFTKQIHCLGRSGDREHSRYFCSKLLFDIGFQTFQERTVPLRCAILKNCFSVLLKDIRSKLAYLTIRKRVKGWIAACKRDHPGLGNHFENFTDCASRYFVKSRGKTNLINVHVQQTSPSKKFSGFRRKAKTAVPLPFSRETPAL